jgi:hypothetical protein
MKWMNVILEVTTSQSGPWDFLSATVCYTLKVKWMEIFPKSGGKSDKQDDFSEFSKNSFIPSNH